MTIHSSVFSWQETLWQQLLRVRAQHRLPHAFLFTGIAGIGKKHFAEVFAQSLLCLSPLSSGFACGHCHSCDLLQAMSHPDLLVVEPEEPGAMIKVDAIRHVVDFMNETAMQNGYRVIILNPANAMNMNAANALLKTLEEPVGRCVFILISDHMTRLPKTIQSRCQKMLFTKPEYAQAVRWLNQALPETEKPQADLLLSLANGAPLRALAMTSSDVFMLRRDLFQGLFALSENKQDPLALAAQFQEQQGLTMMSLLQTFVHDLLKCKLTQGKASLMHFDLQPNFIALANRLSVEAITRYSDQIKKTYQLMSGSLNLNRLLALEELFILWVRYVC